MTESNANDAMLEISDARLADLIAGLNIWTSAGRSQQPEIDMDLCCALMELQRVRANALALRTPSDGERVKPLEWKYYPENNIGAAEWLAAESINGQYFRISRVTDGWRYSTSFYDDIEPAKAAAQQDYNSGVLSCLM